MGYSFALAGACLVFACSDDGKRMPPILVNTGAGASVTSSSASGGSSTAAGMGGSGGADAAGTTAVASGVGGAGGAGGMAPMIAPDFLLTDLNTNSPRYQEAVSPRDYLKRVSGWYFGHST